MRALQARAGDLVSQGQVLATLDSRDAESQKEFSEASIEEARAALEEARKSAQAAQSTLKAAQAEHDLAASTYARFQKLFEARSVSPQELDEVRARRDAAAADVAARETMAAAAEDRIRQIEVQGLAGRRPVAPRGGGAQLDGGQGAGIGQDRRAPGRPGRNYFPGQPPVRAGIRGRSAGGRRSADGPVEPVAPWSERRRHAGTERLPGKVAEVIPVSASGAHTVRFKVDLPSTFAAPSGDFVRILIPSGTRRTLLVPRACVREVGQLTGVFVVDGNAQARFRLIKSAGFDHDRVEVLSGIEPGDRVVAGPGAEVIDGASLEVRS